MRVLLILLAGQAMASMDGSILAVTAPNLRADLRTTESELQLVVAIYMVAFATLVVTGARLGDLLGQRRAFLLGLAGFSLASLAGGLAPSPTALIVARAAQGAAAALMTPQVLSIIQLEFSGERRTRAIGAYSLILAVGVAAGQALGGLLVAADLHAGAWRPALLLNAPIGAVLLLAARRGLPAPAVAAPARLDLPGVAVLSAALLALVTPLTLGREAGWPVWVWPSFALAALALAAFVLLERRRPAPLFDLGVLALPGVAAGVVAVLVVMGAYAGFLLSLTLHLQDGLGFSALHCGLTFAAFAAGFATASMTWPRLGAALRDRLPLLGPPTMAAALLGVGLIAAGGSWPTAVMAPLLFAGGVGHACAFSPLAGRLTTVVAPRQAADLSGLLLTASLVGSALGTAGFVGVYLEAAAAEGSARGLAITTAALAGTLALATACARATRAKEQVPATA